MIGAGLLAIVLALSLAFNANSQWSEIWSGIAAGAGMLLAIMAAIGLYQQRRARVRLDVIKDTLIHGEQRYRAFIQNSAEAIWRFELERPVPVALSEDQQIDQYYQYGYLAECNRMMAVMYGFDDPGQMVGMRLNDILPRDNPRNIEFLRQFIQSGYHLIDAESDDVNRHGHVVHALNNMVGVIENGHGIRVWGTNRDITQQRRSGEEAIARMRQQSALAELSQRAVTDSLQAVIEHASKLVHNALSVDFVTVLEFDPVQHQFRVRFGIGWDSRIPNGDLVPADSNSQAGFTLQTSPTTTRDGFATYEPIVFEDIRNDTRFKNTRLLEQGVVGAVTVMIHGEHNPFGMLGVYTAKTRKFSSDQIEFVQAVANLIAAVVVRQAGHDALCRSEAQNRMLVEQVKDYAIFMIDPDGRAASWNEGVKRVLGYDEEDFLGTPASDLFTQSDLFKGVPQYELAEARARGQANNDRWMVRKDGSRFWASGITTALRDEDGRLLGFTKVMRDDTPRRRVEMQLRRNQRSLSAAQRIAHIGNWELQLSNLKDLEQNVLTWSDEVYRIFGFKPGEFVPTNQRFFQSVHPDDRQAIADNVKAALHGSGVYGIEHRIVRPDGAQRIVHEQAEVEYDRIGRPRRLIGTVQDITDRKQAEVELEHYRTHLEQLVAQRSRELEASHQRLRHTERMVALGTLSAGLGHDMGNLLLPIRIRLDAIELKDQTRTVLEDLQVIRMATEYLQRLSNGLRLLAIDPERNRHGGETTNVVEWWLDAQPILKNALRRGTTLQDKFQPELPAVQLPRHQFMQMIFNLVQNAGDALHDEPEGHVEVWAHRTDFGHVQIGVTDNGPGMSPEVKQRCLEPFYSTKTRGISTGLGLALVHGIVQRAGGQIDIDSEIGQGTTISITLPASTHFSPQNPPPGFIAVNSLSDPRMRSFVSSVLSSSGYQVIEADRPDPARAQLWMTETKSADIDAVRDFIESDGNHRRVVLFGNLTERINDPRVLQLGDRPRPAVVRQTVTNIAEVQSSLIAEPPP
jgi:PAS domain S-box-containing protein